MPLSKPKCLLFLNVPPGWVLCVLVCFSCVPQLQKMHNESGRHATQVNSYEYSLIVHLTLAVSRRFHPFPGTQEQERRERRDRGKETLGEQGKHLSRDRRIKATREMRAYCTYCNKTCGLQRTGMAAQFCPGITRSSSFHPVCRALHWSEVCSIPGCVGMDVGEGLEE